jgi:hypothetical protein
MPVRICSLLLLTLLCGQPALAASEDGLSRGVRLFQQGEFARARDALASSVLDVSLPEPQRLQARMYFAAALFALRDVEGARAQLLAIAREQPHARLDPGEFVPELILLEQEVHAALEAEMRALQPPPPLPVEQHVISPLPPAESDAGLRLTVGVFGLADAAGRSAGAGVGAGLAWREIDASVRVLLGEQMGGEVHAAFRLLDGAVQPRLGARATVVPGLGAYGGGLGVGARLRLHEHLFAVVDLAAMFFTVPEDHRAFALPLTAGLDFAF